MSHKSTTTSITSSLIIVSIFFGIVLSFSALWYWAGTVQDSLRQVVEVTAGGSEAAQQKKIQRMRKELRDTKEDRLLLHTLALSEGEVPGFLNNIELLGSGNIAISVRSIDIDTEKGIISVLLAFSGNFNEVVQVLEDIKGIAYASYIDMFEMRVDKKDTSGSLKQEVSMRLIIPLLVDKE